MSDSLQKLQKLDEYILASIRLSESLRQPLLTYLLNISYLHFCELEENLSLDVAAEPLTLLSTPNLLDEDRAPAIIGSWRWDVLNDIVTSDSEVAKIFNIDPATTKGCPIADYLKALHPDDSERVKRAIHRTTQQGGGFSLVYRLVQSDGSEKWVFALGRAVVENGKVTQFPGTLIDVTNDETRKRRAMRYVNIYDAKPNLSHNNYE